MAKRLLITAYDLLGACAVAFVFSFALTGEAFAYIDPSVMTYTIQAVAGVAVALSTVLGVALRRGRKTMMRLLDIDENARRVVEPEVHRIAPDGTVVANGPAESAAELSTPADAESATTVSAIVAETAKVDGDSAVEGGADDAPATELAPGTSEQAPTPKKRPFRDSRPFAPRWRTRLGLGALAAFFLIFTVYFVAPLEIVAGASADLVYSIGDVWWVPVLPCLGLVVAVALVLSAFRGKAFIVALAVVFGVGVAAYVQALFLNAGLPAANGATILWDEYLGMHVLSSVVWVAIVAAAVVYALRNNRRMQGIVVIVSVFLVIVQGVGLASVAIAPSASDEDGQGKAIMTEDQLYTVSQKNNVIVFILDTYDTAYLRRVLKMNPDLLQDLTGFTNYENATSATIPTRFAIPEMLTGQMPSFDEPYSVYKRQRYARSSFLQDIYDANYSIGLYTDSLRISALPADEQREITGKTVNIHDLPDSMMDFGGTLYSLWQMGQYRDMPWPLKWAFWYYTDEINTAMVVYDESASPDETIYVMDDIRYYNRLCDIGLSVVDDGHDGAFRFIHLLGSHYPFNYDEEVNDLGQDNSDVFKQSQGAIHIVSEYIQQLKDLGVYDDTTIIITADHGYWTITEDPIEETSTPIMFVKPAQSAELDALPIKVDEKPVSHLDLQATILDAMGLDYSEYSSRDFWEGYSMFGDIDPSRKRYYLTTDSLPDLTETQFREYLIDGNALDWDNWSETGRTINAQE